MRTKALAAVLAAAIVAATFVLATHLIGNGSAKDRIEADPPPRLFATKSVTPLSHEIAAQQREAQRRMRPWWKAHGHVRNDKGFVAWLVTQAPRPPRTAERTGEMPAVTSLANRRSPSGIRAAVWLEEHGKKDIWKLYAHDQAEWVSTARGNSEKKNVKDAIKIAKKVTDKVAKRFPRSAPYVVNNRLLDPVAQKSAMSKLKSEKRPCPCSYPSRHAAKAAASRTVLSASAPLRAREYRWMEGQIDYSRLYMGGHYRSDILAGTVLGDMIGLYIDGASSSEPVWPAN